MVICYCITIIKAIKKFILIKLFVINFCLTLSDYQPICETGIFISPLILAPLKPHYIITVMRGLRGALNAAESQQSL